jgi:uncharacterized membrane protein affecting hemolysin expression
MNFSRLFTARSVRAKLLRLYLPPLVAVMVIVFAILILMSYNQQCRNLVDSLDNLVAASSAGIAEAFWEFDPDGIDETLERIAGLSEVVSIAVYEIPEKLIAQSGPIDDLPEADDFRRDAALTFESGEQSESVGNLVITVTNKEIIRGISRRIALAAGIVFMVMLALTGITLVATGRVDRPTRQPLEGGHRCPAC